MTPPLRASGVPPEVATIAAAYPDAAWEAPLPARLKWFTIDQHQAWALRFDPANASREHIEKLHADASSANRHRASSEKRTNSADSQPQPHQQPHSGTRA